MKTKATSVPTRWVYAIALTVATTGPAAAAGAQPCGGMQDLGTLGGTYADAVGVSADGGAVVGYSSDAEGRFRAFRWTASAGMQDLGTLGGSLAFARGVSADGGVVVGQADDADGRLRAFRWAAAGGTQDLGTLGGADAGAFGASGDGGVVVGQSYDAAGSLRAFRWTGILRQVDPLDAANEPAHKTNLYELNQPAGNTEQRTILRRGGKAVPGSGTADIDVVVAECFDPQRHVLSFEAEHTFDGAPVVKAVPFYTQAVPAGQWGCVLREPPGPPESGERIVRTRVFIPAGGPEAAAVGEYSFRAVVRSPTGQRLEDKAFARPVVVLFNPWEPADSAHLPGDAERSEFVMGTAGFMWGGTARSNDPLGWNYAQFADATFLTSLELLDGLDAAGRADPVAVSRWLTDKLDADGGGVLRGCWCEPWTACYSGDPQRPCDWSGGVDPALWRSSAQVFSIYRADPARAAVSYGQCWVYAGLLTSSLRALGIASRPLTNFGSAHDEDGDGAVARCVYFDPPSSTWRIRCEEGVWNFHVWCEAWMRRPGQPGMDGWQAVDATPQEPSDGRFRLGPAPVAAVKAGLGSIPFDVPFVAGEVDADRVLQAEQAGVCVEYSRDVTLVGRRITTKGVGVSAGVDITSTYKTPETTPDPRETPDVGVAAPADVPMGGPIEISVEIRNADAVSRDFSCYAMFHALNDRGERLADIGAPVSPVVTIPPGGVRTLSFAAAWPLVQPVLGSSDVVEAFVVVTRMSDQRRRFEQARVRVLGLPMQIAIAPAAVAVGGDAQAAIGYANPLAAPLANARLLVSGDSGLRIVGPGGTPVVDEEIELGTLPAGASGTITRTLRGSAEGLGGLVGRFVADGAAPGGAVGTVLVTGPCYANCDGSASGPVLNALDFSCFLARFRASDPYANCDGSTSAPTLNALDFACFLNRYRAGCP